MHEKFMITHFSKTVLFFVFAAAFFFAPVRINWAMAGTDIAPGPTSLEIMKDVQVAGRDGILQGGDTEVARPGDDLVYHVWVVNMGDSPALNVRIHDVFSGDSSIVSSPVLLEAPASYSGDFTSGLNMPTVLLPGEQFAVIYRSTIRQDVRTGGDICNQATATADNAQPVVAELCVNVLIASSQSVELASGQPPLYPPPYPAPQQDRGPVQGPVRPPQYFVAPKTGADLTLMKAIGFASALTIGAVMLKRKGLVRFFT